MNKKEQNAQQRAREEDIVLTKVLWWILGAVVWEALLLLVNKFYVNYSVDQIGVAVALLGVFHVLAIVLPICFVLLLAWTLVAWKNGKPHLLPGVLTKIVFALAVSSVLIYLYYDKAIAFLCGAVPAVAVLALIFYLYQREFFYAAVLGALGLVGIRIAPEASSMPVTGYTYLVGLAVILLASAVFFRYLQSHKGHLTIKGKSVEMLAHNANYVLLYVTCVLVAAIVVAAMVLGGLALLYGVLVAWLLILAVYHTVRLM